MVTVVLPCLTGFEVTDYTLFRRDLTWKFRDGINLLLGVNGVGKTTTIRALAFAIVGDLALNKKTTYFRVRAAERKRGSIPKIRVAFTVGQSQFTVSRRLDTLEFMTYTVQSVGGDLIAGTREHEYVGQLLETTGITSLFELDFLFKHLLIREEEAESTLWNAQDHSRVLRLLFHSGDFEYRYAKLQKAVKDRHVRYSQFAQTHAYAKTNLQQFRQKWFGAASPDWELVTRSRAEREAVLGHLHAQEQALEQVLPRVQEARNAIDDCFAERVELDQRFDGLEEELGRLESSLHHGLYAQYTPARMAIRKLEQHHVCMFCDRSVPTLLRDELVTHYAVEEQCLFCHQAAEAVSPRQATESDPELDKLISARRALRHSITTMDSRTHQLREELQTWLNQEAELRSDILQAKERLAELERQLAELSGTSPGWIESEEARLTASVEALAEQVAEAKAALERAQEDITPLRDVERETLSQLADRFESTFSKLVQQYLGEEGSVRVEIKRNQGERSEYAVYTPIIDGTARNSASEVSKSQAVLLDYAFRMTVLHLYKEITSHTSFFVLETSEGVLDAAYVQRIGKLLGDFALDSGHLLVLVNNLSSSDFLSYVFYRTPTESRLDGTLNFLQFGKLTKVQRDGEDVYNHVGHAVFGPAFSAL